MAVVEALGYCSSPHSSRPVMRDAMSPVHIFTVWRFSVIIFCFFSTLLWTMVNSELGTA